MACGKHTVCGHENRRVLLHDSIHQDCLKFATGVFNGVPHKGINELDFELESTTGHMNQPKISHRRADGRFPYRVTPRSSPSSRKQVQGASHNPALKRSPVDLLVPSRTKGRQQLPLASTALAIQNKNAPRKIAPEHLKQNPLRIQPTPQLVQAHKVTVRANMSTRFGRL